MRKGEAVQAAIIRKLQKLPVGKQTKVLDFVESLDVPRTNGRPTVYDRAARAVKRKGLKRLSLAKISAIVRDVRHGHRSSRSL